MIIALSSAKNLTFFQKEYLHDNFQPDPKSCVDRAISFIAIQNKEIFWWKEYKLERNYNPITAMVFSAMFTFQLDNTKR